jgi:hypothetical protein
MMTTEKSKNIRLYGSLIILVLLSLVKDDFTPDYLNTPAASFLSPQNLEGTRISSVCAYPFFWFCSILYTCLFVCIPAYALYLRNEVKLARWCGILLTGAAVLLYVLIFIESTAIDIHLVPKLNRYFHSPIFTLFLVAAIKIKNR